MTKPSALATLDLRADTAVCSVFAVAAIGGDGAVTKRVQLMPMGSVRPRNGVPALVTLRDRAHAEAVVASTLAYLGESEMVIDYDHQSTVALATGSTARAAGWIKALSAEDDGIWGDVEFTASAQEMLAAREYRYISPYFRLRADGTVTRIINAGLTNTPNLDLAALASAIPHPTPQTQDVSMTFAKIGLLLGMTAAASAIATEADILTLVTPLKAKAGALDATASALGVTLAVDATEFDAVATAAGVAVTSAKVDPAKFVPVAAVAEMQVAMTALQGKVDAMGAKSKAATIDDAMKDGRLAPALKSFAEGLDETALASFLAAMPETGLGKKTDISPKGSTGLTVLTDEQDALCSSMGWDKVEYLKQLNEEAR